MSTLLGALVGLALLSALFLITITAVIVVNDVDDDWGRSSSLLLLLLLCSFTLVPTFTFEAACALIIAEGYGEAAAAN